MSARVRSTVDAYLGPDDPTPEAWADWHRAMLAERAVELARAQFDPAVYDDDHAAWSDTTFRQFFLFMYDAAFYDPAARRYLTTQLIARLTSMYGRIDEVLLWHAYPRLGFDARTQFDFYRQMPGGLAGLRKDVCDPLHDHGIRVLVDYNPWDTGTYEELAEIVGALDADGVMLDTMTDVPAELRAAADRRKRGVVFAPELRPKTEDLRHARQSWAQWCDVGDDSTPSIYRNRWLVPRHRQLAIARWDTSRNKDIVYSFFNGAGLVLWDNIFGSLNPYSRADRRLIAETGAVFDRYADVFARAEWLPLVPTGVRGLDANRFEERGARRRMIITLRNRTGERLSFVTLPVPPDAPPGSAWFAFWGANRAVLAGEPVTVEASGTQALVLDTPAAAEAALAHFDLRSRTADVELPEDREPRPRPHLVTPARAALSIAAAPSASASASAASSASASQLSRVAAMVAIPGGPFDLVIRHERRECGCYPDGTRDDANATWGWHYQDILTHELRVVVAPFAIRAGAVTNGEYLEWVHSTHYRPTDEARFLAHIARLPDGALPRTLPAEQAAQPVTHVSLADARAFAMHFGERLPTEAEWQVAVERAGVGRIAGDAWELTESEHTDGHTRFVMLRGGAPLPPGKSEWLVARGVRPSDSHAKYILLSDALDRSDAISFRTVTA